VQDEFGDDDRDRYPYGTRLLSAWWQQVTRPPPSLAHTGRMAVVGRRLVIRDPTGSVLVGPIGGRGQMSVKDAMTLMMLWNDAHNI
jgi:hypothetical protein